MREQLFAVSQLYNSEQIKNLNNTIKNNLIESTDNPSSDSIKTSQVKFVRLLPLQNLIGPFIDFCMSVNNFHYGFDLFPLTSSKILNYNTYKKDEEYTWHIDASMRSPIRDIKLTCLLNCSEENYEGGDSKYCWKGIDNDDNPSVRANYVFAETKKLKLKSLILEVPLFFLLF